MATVNINKAVDIHKCACGSSLLAWSAVLSSNEPGNLNVEQNR